MKRSVAARSALSSTVRALFLAPLRLYQRVISPALPARCKYYPSCSYYAVDAVRELGILRGTIVAAWRLARCNPWSQGGVDEIGDRTLFRDHGCSHHEHRGPGVAA